MKIGFVGFGNMASAMADGWIAAGVCERHVRCAGRYDALVERCEARGMVACHDAAEVVAASDIVVAAVKPYMMRRYSPRSGMLYKRSFCRLPGPGTVPVGAGPAGRRAYLDGAQHTGSVGEGVIACEKASTLSDEQSAVVLDAAANSVRWSSSIRACCLWAARWVVALRHLSPWQSRPWAMRRSSTVSRVPMPIAL